jgi:hypothetical protein
MAKRAIGSPVDICTKEGKQTVSFHFHVELNVPMDTVQ